MDLAPLRTQAPVLAPDEDGWDDARQAWNLTADQHPMAIVLAQSAADVVAAVRFAAANGLKVAAQSTGHGAAALQPLDDTVLVRTIRMDGVSVDPATRVARIEAGALSADLSAAAGEHGLTALGGSSPDVGVVGFVLGGGIGWLSRLHGLTCNTARSFELVTADGEQVSADADQNSDLFWALRGGGGDFGVVTALELELFPIERVYAGSLMWPAAHAPEILPAYLEWIRDLPEEFTASVRFLTLPPLPEVPEPLRANPVIDVTGAYVGDAAEGAALTDKLRGLAEPLIDSWAELPAAGLSRIAGDPEQPVPGLTHHALLSDLPPDAADVLIEHAGPESGSPLLSVGTRQLGGALSRPPANAGALAGVTADHIAFGVGMPMPPNTPEAIVAHLDRVIDALGPWTTGVDYLNFADRPCGASRAFDERTLARLRAIKGEVDPDGIFVAAHPVAA